MFEFLPLIAGVVIGLLVQRISNRSAKVALLVVLSLIVGLSASFISGELVESWAFVLFDAGQVLLVAILTDVLLARLPRRSAV